MVDDAIRDPLPIILVRGFGGLDVADEQALAYQGFNVGTVYPNKRGENYIFEGFILRLLKSNYDFHDATNIVNYFNEVQPRFDIGLVTNAPSDDPLKRLDISCFGDSQVVLDPAMARRVVEDSDSLQRFRRTIWVFRYYDLGTRTFELYGEMLVRLISLIRDLARCCAADAEAQPPKVNIIAHSMGGLIVRQALQVTYPKLPTKPRRRAVDEINKIVTLGTPHQGISFQRVSSIGALPIGAADELEAFATKNQNKKSFPLSYKRFDDDVFPKHRLLTIVGTNYRSYGVNIASRLNRFFSMPGEGGLTYNKSDGLVKISSAQLPGCPRTFVDKCHGGPDSLVNSRESYEIVDRFLHGNVGIRLKLDQGEVLRGRDIFGKSEFYFGVSIKPRFVDFDLFEQSSHGENCYGPFRQTDLADAVPEGGLDWAGPERLVWAGYLRVDADRFREPEPAGRPRLKTNKDVVFRLDVYVGERDEYGFGFSDNVVFRKQYYLQAKAMRNRGFTLFLGTGEDFLRKSRRELTTEQRPKEMDPTADGRAWSFGVLGTGFRGTFRIEIDWLPADGAPTPITPEPR